MRLSSEGPRYWHGQSLHQVDGKIEVGSSWKYERERYLLVEGARWDLVSRIKQAAEEYKKADEQHRKDRENARREFEQEWDDENPSPRYPRVEAIIQEVAGK